MGKKALFFFIFFFIFVSTISSLEINSEEKYLTEESILITISGNFIVPITKEKISLYRGQARSAAEINLEKFGDLNYISLDLEGKNPGNYSIRIEDVEYLTGSKKIVDDILIPFEIIEDMAKLSVSPLALSTSQNFTLYVKNLKRVTSKIKIESSDSKKIHSEKEVYDFRSGENKQINIIVDSGEENSLEKLTISIDDYSKEVLVYVEKESEENKDKIKEFSFERKNVKINLSTNSQTNYFTYLKNIGDSEISNITVDVSEELKNIINISTKEKFSLDKNESIKIDIYVKTLNKSGIFNGYLMATDDSGMKEYLYISLDIIADYIAPDSTNGDIQNPFVNENSTQGGLIDEDESSTSSTSKIIGWAIIIVLIGILAWFFFKKYRGAKRSGIKFTGIKKN